MTDSKISTPEAPRRKLRFGRILTALLVLGLIAAAVYGASWLNARRFYLVVSATEVAIHKGRKLPMGHEPFVPFDPSLRRAYQPVPLPGGLKLPRGETAFDDRVQLDQALYRILVDATEYALGQDNARTSQLVHQYLEQLKALPGTNVQQQKKLQELERSAGIVEARGHVAKARDLLERAEKLLRQAATGAGPEATQVLREAAVVGRARAALDESEPEHAPPEPAPPPPESPRPSEPSLPADWPVPSESPVDEASESAETPEEIRTSTGTSPER